MNSCSLCGKELTLLTGRVKFLDGHICTVCLMKNGIDTSMKALVEYQNIPIDVIKSKIQKTISDIEKYQSFKPEKTIELATLRSLTKFEEIQFNSESKEFAIVRKSKIELYKYNELVGFELLKDGFSVTKGGLGMAAVGAVTFGAAGAIVGGITGGKKTKNVAESLRIKLTLNSISNPVIYLDFISTPSKESSPAYRAACDKAQLCLSLLQLVCNENERWTSTSKEFSSADEILKFKELFDKGIISKEEFEAKKKELLARY